MARVRTVTESIVIAAEPRAVYDVLSDPSNMGRWSPENTGARPAADARAASVGMRFVGSNRRGPARWHTLCTVTAADPGRHFAFSVGAIGVTKPVVKAKIAAWAFRLEPVEGGTLVTQTWEDRRPVRGVLGEAMWAAFDRVVLAGKTFDVHNRATMRVTLRKLKAELEAR